jgi:flagellar hook protein FlgE
MSLFGALFTGVSALTAQSQSIAMISNNIANVNTVGYKRVDAAFSSLVTTETRTARYTPGSVIANREQRIDQQGAIQQTNSTTDLSVSGSGFFVVQRTPTGIQEALYTRAGSFSENNQGFLVNTAGYYLMGWPLDVDGNLPTGQAELSSLRPVDIAFLGGLTRPTTDSELAVNLDAEETQIAYPVSAAQASQFTRGLRVYDSLGTPQDLEFQFIKTQSPTATATTALATPLALDTVMTSIPDVEALESFDITVDGQTSTFAIGAGDTVQDFINSINSDVTIGPLLFAELTPGGQFQIKARNTSVASNLTIADNNVVAGAGLATALGIAGAAGAVAVPATYPDGTTLENVPNTEGWWQLRIVNLGTGAVERSDYLNFNSDGSLNALPDADGERKIQLAGINWGNGSEFQDIDVQIGSFTQFAGEYNVAFSDQNGAELGLRTGVEIDREGIVIARFSNGQTANLYKLPLSTFTAPNALAESSGNVYTETSESGSFNLREAGQGGAGLIEGSTLEASNVDLADEFSKMIITQRAYSAGTKVINTADEMTEELLRLR